MTQTQQAKGFLNWWQNFSSRWLVFETNDPVLARKGYYLSVITLGFTLISALSIPAWMIGVGPANVFIAVYISPLLFFGLYLLTRRGYVNLVGLITILVVSAFSINPTDSGNFVNLTGFLILALVVILAGFLIGTKSMFGMAVFAGILSGISIVSGRGDSDLATPFVPIFYLVLAGLTYMLLQQVQSALNQSQDYARELEFSRDNLEVEVAERTAQLQNSFDLTAQISNLINTSPTLETLFQRTVGLIQSKFDYYHVHIYTYNQNAQSLSFAAGSGIIGQRLRDQAHEINIGENVIGIAAQRNQPLVVNDVEAYSGYVYNPLLPDTRSEMAIPVSTGTRLLAMLDIQNSRLDSFSQADQNLMRSLANQLAVAVNNINLVTEAQETLRQVEVLNAQLTEEQWTEALQETPTTGYVYTPERLAPTTEEWLPSMSTISTELAETENEISILEDQQAMQNELAIPIKLRGQVIGVLGMERDVAKPWNDNDKLIVQALSEQIALALESARLFENTQRNAWRDQAVSEATARVWSTAEIEEVMRAAIEQLGETLEASEVVIQLNPQATAE